MKRMIFDQTVHTWLYGQTRIIDIAKRLNAIGADGMDLSIEANGVNSPKRLLDANILQIAMDNGLKVSSSTALYTSKGLDFCYANEQLRQVTIEFSKRCVDVTAHAGCDRMLIVPGIVSVNHRYHTSREKDWQRAVEGIRVMGEYAAAQGIMLLIEPINRYRVALVHTVAEALQMINDIDLPNIHIVADTFHMQMEEMEGLPNALRKGSHHIKCLHIGDNTRRAPGYGVMDWKSIIAVLYDIEYDGPLSYETAFTGFDVKKICKDTDYMHYFERQLNFGFQYLRQIMLSIMEAKDIVV